MPRRHLPGLLRQRRGAPGRCAAAGRQGRRGSGAELCAEALPGASRAWVWFRFLGGFCVFRFGAMLFRAGAMLFRFGARLFRFGGLNCLGCSLSSARWPGLSVFLSEA